MNARLFINRMAMAEEKSLQATIPWAFRIFNPHLRPPQSPVLIQAGYMVT